jgi:CRISPR-associated protein Cmr2
MSDALTLARQAEKEAKKTRNALAITLSKRSGADRTIAGQWDAQIAERLQYFIDLHRRDALPDSAAYDLHDMAVRLDHQHVPIAAVQAEARRIVQRKRTPQDQAHLDTTILDAFSRHLDRATDARDIQSLAHEIIIARILANAKELALEPRKEIRL